MKKTYINPDIVVVKMVTTHMIALSANIDSSEAGKITSVDEIGAHADDADWEDYE